jgi:hypothetical protein
MGSILVLHHARLTRMLMRLSEKRNQVRTREKMLMGWMSITVPMLGVCARERAEAERGRGTGIGRCQWHLDQSLCQGQGRTA